LRSLVPITWFAVVMSHWMLSVDISCTGDVQDARADNFEESLKERVRFALDPSLQTSSQETNKDILSSLVRNIVVCVISD